MEYTLVSLNDEAVIKAIKSLKNKLFVARDVGAAMGKKDSSAISIYFHRLKKQNKIKIVGTTYLKDSKGRTQRYTVYQLNEG